MRSLVWFRSDLRVRDNTALFHACEAASSGVVAVFTICPQQWQAHDWATVRVDLLLRSLRDLSEELAKLNIPLLIRSVPTFAQVPDALVEVAEEHDCGGLWLNREYEVNELERDEEVVRAFERADRQVRRFTDQVILAPESQKTTQGKFYTVFTPYKKRWIASLRDRGIPVLQPRPSAQEPVPVAADPVPESLEGFDGLTRPDLWKSGELHAARCLQEFVGSRIDEYRNRRDYPGTNGTSVLSPHLAIGTVSPRQCLHAALEANDGQLDAGSDGVTTWISELIWREFYRHVLVGFPRVCRRAPFDVTSRTIRWRDAPDDFERWQDGQTGIPIVDAGMRQLRQTGWMHNRVRMIVAMFLSKNLFLDWRWGERHFMRHLVDGDFASNNGGWQWSASVGTDAAPYFRIFNPVSQSERFDAGGEYIRRFVPELAGLDDRAIHFPHERSRAAAAGLDYPAPMVDLKASRQAAIDAFKKNRAR